MQEGIGQGAILKVQSGMTEKNLSQNGWSPGLKNCIAEQAHFRALFPHLFCIQFSPSSPFVTPRDCLNGTPN